MVAIEVCMKKTLLNSYKKTAYATAILFLMQSIFLQHTQAQEIEKVNSSKLNDVEPPKSSESVSTSSSLDSTNIFNSNTSIAQQAFTPGYELSGGKVGDGKAGLLTSPTRGAPLVFGGLYVYLDARSYIGRNSNILGSTNNTVSSSFVALEPEIVAELKNHGDRYTASYLGNYARYQNSGADNFNHHEIKVAGDNIFDSRTRTGWQIGFNESTDPRGSTDRVLSLRPDQWRAPRIAGFFSYGAKEATGRIEVDGSYSSKTYINNRESTINADVNIFSIATRFFYKVAPKTSMFVELKEIKSDYVIGNSPNSNSDRRVMLGTTWTATAATTGTFKIGYLNKSFERQGVSGFSGVAWEGKAQWTPVSYSSVELTLSKTPADSTGVGDYVLNNNYGISWNHRWSSQIGTKFDMGYINSDYINGNREDKLKNVGIGLTYDVRRWMRLGLDLTNTKRDSSSSNNIFSRNVVLITIQMSL